MSDFFVLQMDDEFGDGVCFDNRQGGRRGSVGLALPPFCEGQAKATPDTMGCEARPQRRRGRGPRGGQGTPPDIGDTLRERGSSLHRPKGQRKYRSSPRSWDVRKGRDTPKDTPAQALLTSRSAARTGCPRPHGPPRRSRTPLAPAASPTLRRLSPGRPARAPCVSPHPSASPLKG